MTINRREFLLRTAAATANVGAAAALANAAPVDQTRSADSGSPKQRPNIVIYHSDQSRWDFLGANELNSSTHTPNLDKLATEGTNFMHCVTNQPLCAPSRSVTWTGRYATNTGVWINDSGGLRTDLPTIATELRKVGYTANYIGKWHLGPTIGKWRPTSPAVAQVEAVKDGWGLVDPEHRGGFADLWEASNLLEFTTHPYWGTIWDRDGKEITWKDQYRVDFLTDRAESFLRQKHEKPFLLVISQLEPHQQNDLNRMVAPKGWAQRYINAFVPPDLSHLPGNWHQNLPDYYGCVESIDASVGRVRKILEEEGLAENTIFVFMSDHGCHFETRNKKYKRSPQKSSIRVPLVIKGPGFERARQVHEVVGLVHLMPTLLSAVGVPIPDSVEGKNVLPLLHNAQAREAWPNAELIQISGSMTGRAIHTKDWTYCIADPTGMKHKPNSTNFHEYVMYDERNDPSELVNLAGRKEYRERADELGAQLKKLIVASGEPEPAIVPAKLYP